MSEMTISGPHSLSIRKKKKKKTGLKRKDCKKPCEERIKMRNYITLVSEKER